MRSYIMQGLPAHSVQELNVGTVGIFCYFSNCMKNMSKWIFLVTLFTRGKSENVFASILKRQREIYGELSLVQQALQRVIVRNQVASIHQD